MQGFEGFLDRGEFLVRVMDVTELAKEVGIPIRPMELIDIDIIGFEACVGTVNRLVDLRTGYISAVSMKLISLPVA